MDVSIIIVNYKGWNYLKDCLDALQGFQNECFDSEVIVVDNCSNDGHLEEFQSQYEQVRFVLNSGNNGFSNGCNFGAALAGGKYLLFLNPDIVVAESAICQLFQILKERSEVTILSCCQVNKKGKMEQIYRFFPSFYTLNGIVRAIYRKAKLSSRGDSSDESGNLVYPDWVSGSLIFISRENFNRIGGWSEDYWLYYEDVDLCWQARKFSGKVALAPHIRVMHNHGGTTRINLQTAALTKSEVIVSLHVFVARNYPLARRMALQSMIVAATLAGRLIPALLGVPFFFVGRLKVYRLIYMKMLNYYFRVLHTGNWLSSRAINGMK